MITLTPEQTASLKTWFQPERPGPLIGSHVINTSQGTCLVDRWPRPQAVLVQTAGNYTLLGDAQVLTPTDLQPHIKGFVETSQTFVPLLKAAFPNLTVWPRLIFTQQDDPPPLVTDGDYSIRRLNSADAPHLRGLRSESTWISKTWGEPDNLTASGFGWGVFVADQLASVSCTFFLGETYEEIGVVTEPPFRGMGLSPACTLALCNDIQARGHRPSWTTSPDNAASIRVAEKLGFAIQRHDQLYVVDIEIPPASTSN